VVQIRLPVFSVLPESAEDIRELKNEADDIFLSHEIKGYINYHEAFEFPFLPPKLPHVARFQLFL